MDETPSVPIDMTPMIDIVFQLITFFMVVINFDAADTDERVKMAISSLARPPKVKPDTELVLQAGFSRVQRKDGAVEVTGGPFLFYAGDSIPFTQLEQQFLPKLRQEFEFDKLRNRVDENGRSRTTVSIRADAESANGEIQKLIQLCQKVGYEKFSLKARQPE
jgi:biopolymer transport protein ExbD